MIRCIATLLLLTLSMGFLATGFLGLRASRSLELAQRQADIPTLSEWGIVAMTLALLAVGGAMIAKRRDRTMA